ncbi:MAG TPA: hypothetical protein VLJ58_13640 [Ramlibacter sp.]|nr:hypothetical protein [Ramlibacter sp.]
MRFSAAVMPLYSFAPLRKPADHALSRQPPMPPAVRSLPEAAAACAAPPLRDFPAEPLLDLDQRVRLSGEW